MTSRTAHFYLSRPHSFIHLIFNIVLLSCLCQVLLFPSYVLSSQQFLGKCKSICDKRREKGQKQAFQFRCTDFEDKDEQQKCRNICEFCPKEVCDETVSLDSDNDWTCPEESLTGKCKSICADHRPFGKRENFAVTVDSGTSCKGNGCPAFVCDSKNPKKYHCPYEDFDGECRMECDKAREHPSATFQVTDNVKPFNFKCSQKYNGKELSECQDTCRSKCPQWVCDASEDPNEYHCPSAQINGDCKDLCDKHRNPKNSDAYVYRCEEECGMEEKKACESCVGPAATHNFVCNRYDLANLNFFLCPPKEPDSPKATARHSYKGTCKDRCEANRGGGFGSYELNCHERYNSKEEISLCQKDCKECPDEVCDEKNNISILKCRGVNRELERERREREEKREPHKKEIRAIVISFGVCFLLTFLVAFGLILYFSLISRPPPEPKTEEPAEEEAAQQEQDTKTPLAQQSQAPSKIKQPQLSVSSPF